jgi:tetratricopeptide (TPR) repeat protein
MPTTEFRLQTVRFLEELKLFKSAIKILDTIVQEDDTGHEAWYHLAFSHYNLKKYKNAKECLKNVKDLMIKNKINDPEIKLAGEELYINVLE